MVNVRLQLYAPLIGGGQVRQLGDIAPGRHRSPGVLTCAKLAHLIQPVWNLS